MSIGSRAGQGDRAEVGQDISEGGEGGGARGHGRGGPSAAGKELFRGTEVRAELAQEDCGWVWGMGAVEEG